MKKLTLLIVLIITSFSSLYASDYTDLADMQKINGNVVYQFTDHTIQSFKYETYVVKETILSTYLIHTDVYFYCYR